MNCAGMNFWMLSEKNIVKFLTFLLIVAMIIVHFAAGSLEADFKFVEALKNNDGITNELFWDGAANEFGAGIVETGNVKIPTMEGGIPEMNEDGSFVTTIETPYKFEMAEIKTEILEDGEGYSGEFMKINEADGKFIDICDKYDGKITAEMSTNKVETMVGKTYIKTVHTAIGDLQSDTELYGGILGGLSGLSAVGDAIARYYTKKRKREKVEKKFLEEGRVKNDGMDGKPVEEKIWIEVDDEWVRGEKITKLTEAETKINEAEKKKCKKLYRFNYGAALACLLAVIICIIFFAVGIDGFEVQNPLFLVMAGNITLFMVGFVCQVSHFSTREKNITNDDKKQKRSFKNMVHTAAQDQERQLDAKEDPDTILARYKHRYDRMTLGEVSSTGETQSTFMRDHTATSTVAPISNGGPNSAESEEKRAQASQGDDVIHVPHIELVSPTDDAERLSLETVENQQLIEDASSNPDSSPEPATMQLPESTTTNSYCAKELSHSYDANEDLAKVTLVDRRRLHALRPINTLMNKCLQCHA